MVSLRARLARLESNECKLSSIFVFTVAEVKPYELAGVKVSCDGLELELQGDSVEQMLHEAEQVLSVSLKGMALRIAYVHYISQIS